MPLIISNNLHIALKSGLASNSQGNSVPVRPNCSALTNTTGFAASTSEYSYILPPISIVSFGFPVGNTRSETDPWGL